MGELSERRWAVMSERGCEMMNVDYQKARRRARQLAQEDVRGLCIVSDAAARHLPPVNPVPPKRRRQAASDDGHREHDGSMIKASSTRR